MADPFGPTITALRLVRRERERQAELKAAGRFKHTLNDPELTLSQKLAAVTEEVGEVARVVQALEGMNDDLATVAQLRDELTQVAALCVAWLEGLQ